MMKNGCAAWVRRGRDARRAADARRCGEADVHGDMIPSLRWMAEAARRGRARRSRRRRAHPHADANARPIRRAVRQMLRNPIHMARESTACAAPQFVARSACGAADRRRSVTRRLYRVFQQIRTTRARRAAATKRRARRNTYSVDRPEPGEPVGAVKSAMLPARRRCAAPSRRAHRSSFAAFVGRAGQTLAHRDSGIRFAPLGNPISKIRINRVIFDISDSR